MKVTYKLNREDYSEFTDYGLKNMDSAIKQIKTQRIAMVVVFTLVAIFFGINKKMSWEKLIPLYAIVVILWTIVYPKILDRTIKNRLNKSFEKNDKLLEEKTVEIREDGFYVIKEDEDLFVTKTFFNVINADNSIYLYLNSDSAYIIPKRAFSNKEEIREFLRLVREMSEN